MLVASVLFGSGYAGLGAQKATEARTLRSRGLQVAAELWGARAYERPKRPRDPLGEAAWAQAL